MEDHRPHCGSAFEERVITETRQNCDSPRRSYLALGTANNADISVETVPPWVDKQRTPKFPCRMGNSSPKKFSPNWRNDVVTAALDHELVLATTGQLLIPKRGTAKPQPRQAEGPLARDLNRYPHT